MEKKIQHLGGIEKPLEMFMHRGWMLPPSPQPGSVLQTFLGAFLCLINGRSLWKGHSLLAEKGNQHAIYLQFLLNTFPSSQNTSFPTTPHMMFTKRKIELIQLPK